MFNYAASQGVEVIYIPGNHDEKLRPLIDMINRRKHHDTIPQNVHFRRQDVYETAGDKKYRFKILHGDENDPSFFFKPWFRPITYAVSAGYDFLVRLNHKMSSVAYRAFGVHLNLASKLKKSFKDTVGFLFSHDSFMRGLESDQYDGAISGHTHTAVFSAFRKQTERQIRMIHRVWPARNRDRHSTALAHAVKKYKEHSRDKILLDRIMDDLRQKHVVAACDRFALVDIFAGTKKDAYDRQKKGIAAIFKRYAAHQPIDSEDDRLYVQTVIRQFATRSVRKI